MIGDAVDLYGAAFVARHSRGSDSDRAGVSEPGVRGVVSVDDDDRRIRLLVTDDRGYARLSAEVPAARRGIVHIFDTAPRCDELLRGRPGWEDDGAVTAMVLRDVHAVPAAPLPGNLALRPVRRLGPEAPGAVPLEDAVAVAVASDPRITEPAAQLAGFLRALPGSVRLFAAVDEGGVARATSGCDVFGEDARIFFVDTEPSWRRRGIGCAMTVAALREAASSGARRAVLEATDDGASVYARLGFEAAGRLSRYFRTD